MVLRAAVFFGFEMVASTKRQETELDAGRAEDAEIVTITEQNGHDLQYILVALWSESERGQMDMVWPCMQRGDR